MTTVVTDSFRQAIEQAGLTPPDAIIGDGKLRRFGSNGDCADDAGWYVFYADGIPAGSFGCWRTGIKQTWCSKSDHELTKAEHAEYRRRMERAKRDREEDERSCHAEAATRAQTIWTEAQPADGGHPYLQRKAIGPHDLRVDNESRLIIPVMINKTITSLQFISPGGDKKFLPGGELKGGHFIIGDLNGAKTILECEGYATGASLYEATTLPVVIAFSASNLKPVAQNLRQRFPDATILLCGDHDENGTGQTKAREAAEAVDGVAVVPDEVGTDWNDVAVLHGLEAIRRKMPPVLKPSPHLLDEVETFLRRFISYPSEHARVAHVLWIAHTHLMTRWESTPRLAALSPEPASGKTRALELTETLVPNPVETINSSAAYIFRKVAVDQDHLPTILHDEIDAIFGERAREHEDMRAIINAGHRRGATAGRCVVKGKTVVTQEFPAYCAVAMAGLGNLPDTILTRSIVIKMRRRAPTEPVEPYRRRLHAPEGHRLRDRLARWAAEVHMTLNTSPTMPDGIADRDADVWEPLLAVADAAGGDWPTKARVAGVTLVTESKGERGSLGIRLLSDLRTIFGEIPKMKTTDILDQLIALDESPWGDLKGKPLDARRLSLLLKPYGVGPKPLRNGGEVFKGYERGDLLDAWARYLSTEKTSVSPSPKETVTNGTKETKMPDIGLSSQKAVTSVTGNTSDQEELIFEEYTTC